MINLRRRLRRLGATSRRLDLTPDKVNGALATIQAGEAPPDTPAGRFAAAIAGTLDTIDMIEGFEPGAWRRPLIDQPAEDIVTAEAEMPHPEE